MSTTVGARLKVLSGMSNATVGAMFLAIGSGATVGAILVNYSGLPTGTVAQHLLVDHVISQPVTHGGGGGGKHKGDWYRYYRNPSEDRVRPIASEIRELYEAAIEISPIKELSAIHAIVDNYVEKPTDDYARLPIIPAPVIDWAALVNDLEQVYALARLYDRLIDEEEAAFLLLM
jgi:hypothetical protein